jgi:hypothetical protein
MHKLATVFTIAVSLWSTLGFGLTPPPFKKVMIVVFENTDYRYAIQQKFFAAFAARGALFTNFYAETHPSQPNYIAMISGDLQDVDSDDNFDIDARHIGDLLEEKGKSWKVYAEAYPGECYLGMRRGSYVRKHEPFASFKNVQENPERCARIVNASQLDIDRRRGSLPDFSLFIPDLNNDGHDTGIAYANRWFEKTFAPLVNDPAFMKDLLLVATFDESGLLGGNRIYTAMVGESIRAGTKSSQRLDHYSLLRTIEETFALGTLGKNDATAEPITGIWR